MKFKSNHLVSGRLVILLVFTLILIANVSKVSAHHNSVKSDQGNESLANQLQTDLPLRILADKAGLLIGVRAFLKDDAQKKVVEREFNTSTRTCYPNSIDRSPGQHDLESFNTGVNWLYERGMKPMHHMLFGPSQYEAPWVREITSVSRLDSMMKARIRTIMESNNNSSKVNVWNVVNEALSWNKEEIGNYFAADKVVWAGMGYEEDKSGLTGTGKINDKHPVFIRKAFEYASQFAKGKLELRDNGCETPGRKEQALYQLVRHLQNSGVKIDGVGLQCHYNIEGEGVLDPKGLAEVIRKFRKIGVEVYLTEVDFGRKKAPWTPELAEKQKQEYKKLITVALEEGVSQVHFWGLRDADENWRGDENPLLFDENLNPKPAYYGVKEALTEFLENKEQKAKQNAVQPGEFIVEPPTLTNLGFEWYIKGDNNRNATVSVEYRISGTEEWKEALPLLRLGDEHVGRAKENLDYTVPHMFAGSILDVAPDTEYECRFTMKDGDNNVEAVKIAKVRTRAEPKAFPGGRILHVYPAKWVGEKQEPSFTTLLGAYYGAGLGDWNVVRERTVSPGDIIEVHAGLYEANRNDYVTPEAIPFDGTYYLTVKATKEKPIVIRAAGDGEVIFDGAGAHTLFDVSATENHIFEGLTIRNADIAFYAGNKDAIGAKDLTIRKCRMEDVGEGIITEYAGSTNFYIADNVIIGRDDRYRLLGWYNTRNIYGINKMFSYIGIKVYGSGHVICNNALAFFHDGIDISTYGTPESEQDLKSVSIDIYNNDLHLMADDFIESDGGVHNIRVMRNRGVNAGEHGLSAQPVFGGPVYFIRNVLYNLLLGGALKVNAKPAGVYVLHNTFICENNDAELFSNAHFRNNLFLGSDVPGRPVGVFTLATSYSTYDYDGYRPNQKSDFSYQWIAPPPGQLQNYSLNVSRDGKTFSSLKSLSMASGLEKHGVEIDYDIFENLQPPTQKNPGYVYHATDLNFKLNPKGKAVDMGERLPGINNNFTGKAPDLGALETGKPEPVYGPRGEIFNSPFYR